jgi:hypothetical protein
MMQAYQPESLQAAGAFSTPPRSSPPFFEQPTNDENLDPTPGVPSGWQAFHDERNQLVYFNKATGKMELSLEDLFKKPRSSEKRKNGLTTSEDYPLDQSVDFLDNGRVWSPRAHPPPPSPKRPSKHSPMADVAKSSIIAPFIVTPDDRVTRFPGVVSLVSSCEEGRPKTMDDEETVLDDLPRTEEFDYDQHRGSDRGRDDNNSDNNDDESILEQ